MKIEKILGYDVHRKKVKNMNLRINQNMEVYISAPLNLHSSYIENFIRSKEGWIKKVLNKIEDVKLQHKEYEYTTGEIHPLRARRSAQKRFMGLWMVQGFWWKIGHFLWKCRLGEGFHQHIRPQDGAPHQLFRLHTRSHILLAKRALVRQLAIAYTL